MESFEKLMSLINNNAEMDIINKQAEQVTAKELLIFGTEVCLSNKKTHAKKQRVICALIVNTYKKLGNNIYLDNVCICINAVVSKELFCDFDLVLDWIGILEFDCAFDPKIKTLMMVVTHKLVTDYGAKVETIRRLLVLLF
jgi:hypothetical protein